MVDTTKNFLQALSEWTGPEPKPVFFRLYHDDQGYPLTYSMEDIPGTFIEIDQETYVKSSYNVRVVDGKLKHLDYKKVLSKLKPNNQGIPCHPQDVAVVVYAGPNIKWKNVTYGN